MARETVDGVPVDDEQIESWAAEAERGYPVEQHRKRGRRPAGAGSGSVIPVRMDDELLRALAARAERDHVSRSEIIRDAVRAFVA